MNPFTRMTWTLMSALLMWLPVAYEMIVGNIDFVRGGECFLIALIIGWIGSSIVLGLMARYHYTMHRVENTKRQIEAIEARSTSPDETNANNYNRRRADN